MDGREQSYYYQRTIKAKKRQWGLPRAVNRFIHQHPRAILAGLGIFMVASWFRGGFKSLYYYYTMSENEYTAWKAEQKRAVMRLAKYGEGFKIPFTNRTIDFETPEEVALLEQHDKLRRKKIDQDLDKLMGYFGVSPPIKVPEDD